jgi:uncharacterized protein (TIGR00730 family)
MRHICVFAGSNLGTQPAYAQAAVELGQELISHNIGLVYGGASVGLMGIVADTVLQAGGEVIGVIPQGLFTREVAHTGLTKLYSVKSMHERKALMADLSDGFVALPGGFGTFDELFEIATWNQIGIHAKPIGLLNVADYFTPLLQLVSHASQEGFISSFHAQLLAHYATAHELIEAFLVFEPRPLASKWTNPPP